MFRNYLVTAVNNLLKSKLFSVINILGLAVGLACTVLIGLYVVDELSYDGFFADSERIYRVSRDYHPAEFRVNGRYPASINAPFAPQLKNDFPQIEEVARLFNVGGPIFMVDNMPVVESDVGFVDQAFLDVFSFTWLEGNPADALLEPDAIVLTRAMAAKYFPGATAVGKQMTLVLSEEATLRVTGVIENLPGNTHFSFAALASMSTLTGQFGATFLENWQSSTDFHTYLKLLPGAQIEELQNQFPAFVDRYVGENSSIETGITAMPLTAIHLHSSRTEELRPPGNISNVYAFIAIAIGILLIACINFMNLSTARSSQRSKEVGMRKVIGAGRSQLVRQFLGEAIFLALLAMFLAIVLVELLLPAFRTLTGKLLDFAWLQEAQIGLALLALVIVVGVAAGSYPAFFLASFKPALVLKGDRIRGSGNALFRRALVVLQFAISIALVVSTAVIYTQMNYARSIDLGIEREQVVVISGTRGAGLGTQWAAMKQQLLSHPEISEVTRSHYRPFTHDDNSVSVVKENNGAEAIEQIKYMAVDYDFFETYGVDLLAGRTFSEERGTDRISESGDANPSTGSLIINATLARSMGWTPEEAVDRVLQLDAGGGTRINIPVIGVTVDSYFESLTTPIEPLLFFVPPANFRLPLREGAVRVTGSNMEQTLAHIDATWREFLPTLPLRRHFLDQDFEALYRSEQQQARMLGYFTALAIFIACLGLYGLASFNAERRTKEIGVRKVMGGSVWSIVVLLTNDFSRLVLLSNLIAWPVAYFVMSRWLENFAYRIDLTPLVFIGSGLIALCIAWVTVGGTAAKAANAKPVLALRYE